MIEYQLLNGQQARGELEALTDLLQECVTDGASVGFTDPTDRLLMRNYWLDSCASLDRGERLLLVARQRRNVVATVTIIWNGMPNGRHRAEIGKLLVHPAARRQGIARQLMQRAEQYVKQAGRSLMVLDTRSGDIASLLYLSLGWEIAGAIPYYAQSPAGAMDATTVMYKRLA
ncbi:GNAT family N-acetyltransferase [Mixta tenebrionis]|uniref:GNAT family N-acetyltransferase n=1 Tax=Mixta tenebrionis TaxID=2562439 RepID=A0A506VFN9_9GAMM|nr:MULTISPECIES: GNAT family N-acetyltransferase [Mixta]QHM76123.1 Acetyltransferase [Mixta theicola]TPW44647.1 GNAT family N-acetyltransferase [Mixta tenebrionis]